MNKETFVHRLFEQELEKFKKLPRVGQVRQKGLMAGIELAPYAWEERIGIRVCRELRGRGILLRPLGNVIVLMPPLSITPEQIRFLCRETLAAIEKITRENHSGISSRKIRGGTS